PNIINIVADEEIIPELLQSKCNPKDIFKMVDKLLNDKNILEKQIAKSQEIINNFKKYQFKTLNLCTHSINKSKKSKNVYRLNKKSYKKIQEKSFDLAILEKSRNINAIKLNIPWSDLGSWKEISNIFKKNKSKYFKKSNVFYRPWGKYINLYSGKGFLVKELTVNSKSSI
ncbi:MAG: hypothetical protein QGH27_10970, partial [SAR324 cluster bacterium]|nr:hypothetical protein [SAR324 cluster bacterium]